MAIPNPELPIYTEITPFTESKVNAHLDDEEIQKIVKAVKPTFKQALQVIKDHCEKLGYENCETCKMYGLCGDSPEYWDLGEME